VTALLALVLWDFIEPIQQGQDAPALDQRLRHLYAETAVGRRQLPGEPPLELSTRVIVCPPAPVSEREEFSDHA
jgi:hypothetical protein